MAKLLEALNSLFSAPEYASRIPETVRTAIATNGFGSITLDNDTANNIYSIMLNKWARQDIYQFEFSDVDLTRFDKGYLPFGDIIEDDYIDVATAREFPVINQGGTVDPFIINHPTIKPSYYVGTFSLQYWTTTRTMDVKKAFMSENNMSNFIAKARNILPESLKLDRYLIMRNMLAQLSKEAQGNKILTINIEAPTDENDYMTYLKPEEVQDIIFKISMSSEAMSKSSTAWNKLGVMNHTPKKNQVLFINAGVYRLMKSVLYNSYHDAIEFGIPEENIIPISGFGVEAAQEGLFAVILDERALKSYTTEQPDMENIYNPAGKYWNTWLTYQGKLGYSLHANFASFKFNEIAGV